MKPGRELDRLVAEAMGYTSLRQGHLPGELYVHHPTRSSSEDELRYVPHYSTDGKAAWEVWEWLEVVTNFSNTRICLVKNSEGEPSVIKLVGNETVEEIAKGQSYAHAIALAVLATKEED